MAERAEHNEPDAQDAYAGLFGLGAQDIPGGLVDRMDDVRAAHAAHAARHAGRPAPAETDAGRPAPAETDAGRVAEK